MRLLLYLVTLSIFISGCGSKLSLQKRRYTKGFYLASSHNTKLKKEETVVKSATQTATDAVITETIATVAPVYVKQQKEPVQQEKHVSIPIKNKGVTRHEKKNLLPDHEVFSPKAQFKQHVKSSGELKAKRNINNTNNEFSYFLLGMLLLAIVLCVIFKPAFLTLNPAIMIGTIAIVFVLLLSICATVIFGSSCGGNGFFLVALIELLLAVLGS